MEDADVSRRVLDYFLRQPLDALTLNNLLRVLPIPDDNPRLKKWMLLRRIETEITNSSVSEKLLGFLECIEELHHQEGIETPDSMKRAYCAVAVDCTVRFLEDFEVVKRVWRDRVWKMEERCERAVVVGLVCDEFREWRDAIEAAMWDPSVSEDVRAKGRENANGVLEAIRVYVDEAWKIMGPSFIEAMLGTLTLSEDAMREVLGGDRVSGDSTRDMNANDKDEELRRGVAVPRPKHVAMKHSRGATNGSSRGVKIPDTEEMDLRKKSKKYKCPPSPEISKVQEVLAEISKVQEALKTSLSEIRAVVKDPLPAALQLAENLRSFMGGQNMNQKSSVRGHNGKNFDAANPSVGTNPEAAFANEGNCANQRSGHQNDVPKPSSMVQNGAAQSSEWDDSTDSLSEASFGNASRLHLSTSRRRLVSPLKKYESPKISRRRRKKWSTLEADTLRTGVQKLGRGNWKLILNTYHEIFEERTEVDLKDKWRNMTRY